MYPCGGNGPNFVVVRPHEEVCDTGTHHANNPFVKVLRLAVGHASLESGVNHAVHALDLLFLGQHGDVVLERVRDPEVLAADVRDSLVGVPIRLFWQGLVDAVVKVLVVGEDDMAADIVELVVVLEETNKRCYKMYSRSLQGSRR